MNPAPKVCPMCGSQFPFWRAMSINRKGLSAGKALAGGILLGPVGAVVGGVMGKKQTTYICGTCGFYGDYDYNAMDDIAVSVNNATPLNSYFSPQSSQANNAQILGQAFGFFIALTFALMIVLYGFMRLQGIGYFILSLVISAIVTFLVLSASNSTKDEQEELRKFAKNCSRKRKKKMLKEKMLHQQENVIPRV